MFEHRHGIWTVTSCAFCINPHVHMCYLPPTHVSWGVKVKERAQRSEGNHRSPAASIYTACLCLLFVIDHAGDALHTHFTHSTVVSASSHSFLTLSIKRKSLNWKWRSWLKKVICRFQVKWIVKEYRKASLYSSAASKQFCLWQFYTLTTTLMIALLFWEMILFFLMSSAGKKKKKHTSLESIVQDPHK